MALIDKETIRSEIERLKIKACGSQAKEEEITAALSSLDLVIRFLDTLPESAKRGYKDCNGCEYNRTIKDQIGWQFRGCFGGEYKGKPIAEIELCPLKVDTLPEQPELKPKAIVIRPVVNLQKELMGVSAEVKDAVMLLLKEGWSLKAPDSEREFDQRAVCAGFSSIPPSYKLDVKKQPVTDCHDLEQVKGPSRDQAGTKFVEEGLDVTDFCKPIDPGIAQCVADHWWEMIGEESTNKKPVEGLEEEMEKFFETMPVLEHENIFEDTFQNIARHFAEWGRKQVLQEIYNGEVKPVDKITAAWLDDEQNT